MLTAFSLLAIPFALSRAACLAVTMAVISTVGRVSGIGRLVS